MEAKHKRDLKEEEQRCEALKQICEEEEEELRELNVLGEELEVRIEAVVLTYLISKLISYNP